ncbi:hypothetical protein JCM11641_004772 [Rhodosporidiobolus odoratus]
MVVDDQNTLATIYTNPFLPAAIKSLVFRPLPSSPSPTGSTSALLFVAGAREYLAAFHLTYLDPEDGTEELLVREVGTMLAEEGKEVRCMDIALVPLPSGGIEEQVGVLGGYSDGSLKVRFVFISPLAVFACSVTNQNIAVGLPPPFCCFHPHQSGINALAVRDEGSSLVVVSGGDDNALSACMIELYTTPSGELQARLGPANTVKDAHASTIQGLDCLHPTLLASSSVDQRLNLYHLSSSTSSSPDLLRLRLVDSTCLDVGDCSAQVVVPTRAREEGEGEGRVAVAGIGVEVVGIDLREG